MPLDALILLDTNIILQLVRNNMMSQQLEADYRLISRPNGNLISYVTVGEMYALSLKLGWGEDKIARLNEILDALVIININKPNVVENYARINYFSEKVMKPARPLGQNDIWIAATAKTVGAWLMTTDKDFDHLHPKYLKRILIDAKTGETIDRTS